VPKIFLTAQVFCYGTFDLNDRSWICRCRDYVDAEFFAVGIDRAHELDHERIEKEHVVAAVTCYQ